METRTRRADPAYCALTFAAGMVLAAAQAHAADPKDKGLFDRAEAEPFVLTITWPGYFLDVYGIAERPEGGFWIVGDAIENATGESEGYLAVIDDGGLVVEEHTLRVAGAESTEFWWPAPLADGRLAVAVAVDPFDPVTADGGVAIIDGNGRIESVRLLSELGLPGGEIPARDRCIRWPGGNRRHGVARRHRPRRRGRPFRQRPERALGRHRCA